MIAFAALSQGKLVNVLRSAALLSPIAHMTQIPSELTKIAAELFLANVSGRKNYYLDNKTMYNIKLPDEYNYENISFFLM